MSSPVPSFPLSPFPFPPPSLPFLYLPSEIETWCILALKSDIWWQYNFNDFPDNQLTNWQIACSLNSKGKSGQNVSTTWMFWVWARTQNIQVVGKLPGCHYNGNDVSLSEKTLSQNVVCTTAVFFVDIAVVFVTGFTRLLLQPRAAVDFCAAD